MLTKYCDLHTHTVASDGSLTPTQLVEKAGELGLACIALTDHDTVAGIPEALESAKRCNIRLIPGIELSADCQGLSVPDPTSHSLHILGYFSPKNIMNMVVYQDWLKAARDKRNQGMFQKAREKGIDITLEDIKAEAGGEILTRGHFLRALVKKGYASDKSDAFDKFLGAEGILYVRKEKLEVKKLIAMIRENGGIPVLAHPVLLKLDWETLESLVLELKDIGVMGMEAIYVENKDEDTRRLTDIANRNGMFITGGSDFHGTVKPDIALGIGHGNLRVPIELADELIRRIESNS